MEDPDNRPTLLLPNNLPKSAAEPLPKVVQLPLRTHASATQTASSDSHASKLEPASHKAPGQRPPALWYALHLPQLNPLPVNRQQHYLNQLAALIQQVSSTISFHPLTLICEIRSSLKYFGGVDVIHDKLRQLIQQQLRDWKMPEHFFYAASPTVTASLLLARSGHNVLIYQKDNLRSALGALPTSVLELKAEPNRRLYSMGVRHLRDIWRLPSDGLRKRFGSDLLDLLNKSLGKVPEPTRNYLPPPAFSTCYELPYELENLDRLLPIADELFAQLCDFLRQRDLATSHLTIALHHEKRDPSEVNLGLRQASRAREHLMLLLETHFNNFTVPAPITAIKVTVKKFDAYKSHSESLLAQNKAAMPAYSDSSLTQFMEQLQARLGEHHIKSISTIAEHCPEYASRQFDYCELDKSQHRTAALDDSVARNPRPFWLLKKPMLLAIRRGKLFYRKPITIIRGPERIETYWWSGKDVRRDYYVAKEMNGCLLWIFREKSAERNWYLHGFFA